MEMKKKMCTTEKKLPMFGVFDNKTFIIAIANENFFEICNNI